MHTVKLTIAAAIGTLLTGGVATANHHEGAAHEKRQMLWCSQSRQERLRDEQSFVRRRCEDR